MSEPLSFDWESVQGQRVTAIEGINLQLDQVARTHCDALMLRLDNGVLHVSVNADTDEVVVKDSDDAGKDWAPVEALKEYVGYELGWCWIARNYLGYADALMLSFAGIDPEIALVGIASSLQIYRLTRI